MSKKKNIQDRTAEQLAKELAEALSEEMPAEDAHAEKKSVEELLVQELSTSSEASEETVSEEVVEDPTSKETPEDEMSSEEVSTVEEAPAEEAPAEESSPEEAPAEEASVEETTAEEALNAPKRKLKKWMILLIIVGVLLALGVVAYLMISMHYKERFFYGTRVNGIDCSGMTTDEVEKMMQEEVEKYALTIVTSNGESEQINGVDIDVAYIGYNQIQEAFAKQNSYLWPSSFVGDNNIKAEIVFDYNKEKLDAIIAQLECMKAENQVAPVNATVIYQDGAFVIQEEVYGTQIDTVKLSEVIHGNIATMNSSVDLEEVGCYVQPLFTKDSAEVISARDEMNSYLQTKITYSFESVEVTIDKDTIVPWISVDANMTPIISTDLVKTFTSTLSAKYNTPDRAGVLVTPTGKEVAVAQAGYGRTVGTDAEVTQIVSEIKEGKTVVREPVFSRQETPEDQTIWGSTYAEVDIEMQHMWFIQNGQVVFESDVVTGVPNAQKATPTGTFTILEKKQNKVLRGNIMPNGRREYETPVAYWARITWSGVGFHDATWQAEFGGTRYQEGYGSHGCINMPLDAVRTFYDLIYVGCPVIVHN